MENKALHPQFGSLELKTEFKRSTIASFLYAFPQATIVLVVLVFVVTGITGIETQNVLVVFPVLIIPVISIAFFSEFTQRWVISFCGPAQMLIIGKQWYWATEYPVRKVPYAEIADISIKEQMFPKDAGPIFTMHIVFRDAPSIEFCSEKSRAKALELRNQLLAHVGHSTC